MSQFPLETLVTSADGLAVLAGCCRGEEPLKVYFQDGKVLACLLGLMAVSAFPWETGLGDGPAEIPSRDEVLLLLGLSLVLGFFPGGVRLWRSSSEIQPTRLDCWWCWHWDLTSMDTSGASYS